MQARFVLWAGAITLFELARFNTAQPMYEQGLILFLPHLVSLTGSRQLGGEPVAIESGKPFPQLKSQLAINKIDD
jgi:hypothetical protein